MYTVHCTAGWNNSTDLSINFYTLLWLKCLKPNWSQSLIATIEFVWNQAIIMNWYIILTYANNRIQSCLPAVATFNYGFDSLVTLFPHTGITSVATKLFQNVANDYNHLWCNLYAAKGQINSRNTLLLWKSAITNISNSCLKVILGIRFKNHYQNENNYNWTIGITIELCTNYFELRELLPNLFELHLKIELRWCDLPFDT